MKVKNAAMAPLRWSRHCPRAVRSLSPLAVFGLTTALFLGGTGIASAANGGNFILGHTNNETTMSKLSNSAGTPLKLIAPSTAAPLKVSNSNLVSGLNAQFVSGMSASQLSAGHAWVGVRVGPSGNVINSFNTFGGGAPTITHSANSGVYDIFFPQAPINDGNSILVATPDTPSGDCTATNADYALGSNGTVVVVETKDCTNVFADRGFHLVVFG